jgi:hypothetical protein
VNKVLGKMFGPRREEVTGGRREMDNEDLRNLYHLPNVIRIIYLWFN